MTNRPAEHNAAPPNILPFLKIHYHALTIDYLISYLIFKKIFSLRSLPFSYLVRLSFAHLLITFALCCLILSLSLITLLYVSNTHLYVVHIQSYVVDLLLSLTSFALCCSSFAFGSLSSPLQIENHLSPCRSTGRMGAN